MAGVREYCEVFERVEQIGRLVVIPSSHARGKTFRIYVLPEGVKAKFNGSGNPPLNEDIVEVYGVVDGQAGWTEKYGWLHEGKWQQDFEEVYQLRIAENLRKENEKVLAKQKAEQAEKDRIAKLLADYS